MEPIREVLVTGGAGYVGTSLVMRLLGLGYRVRVLDLYWFGEHVLDSVKGHPNLTQIKGDLCDQHLVRNCVKGCDAVIHLACISNDPSFELNPGLGRRINYDAFGPLVKHSRAAGVRRFVYASSSSVYGVSEVPDVTEEHPLRPLTDYSKFKALCEPILLEQHGDDFTAVVIRPATVCGYSPRQRLDLTVNILTNHAVNLGKITVFGGDQLRPNLHVEDMVDLYVKLLEVGPEVIGGEIFNAGYHNHSVAEIAQIVRGVVAEVVPGRQDVPIFRTPSDDHRSYHISSEKIGRVLGFLPRRSIADAARDLALAFQAGKLPDPMGDPRYYNIKALQQARIA
jgi:nucleoside-diphosphate-sugar epimerase